MTTKQRDRANLLAFLKEWEENGHPDPENAHSEADKLLMLFLADPEVTVAWERAARSWWYA